MDSAAEYKSGSLLASFSQFFLMMKIWQYCASCDFKRVHKRHGLGDWVIELTIEHSEPKTI